MQHTAILIYEFLHFMIDLYQTDISAIYCQKDINFINKLLVE